MSLMSSPRPLPVRRLRRHGVARWWLAGFIVGCLLPATLYPVDALRNSERSAYVTFFVPAVLRAQSRHIAWARRIYQRWLGNTQPVQFIRQSCGFWFGERVVSLVAAQDVFTRRGPPSRGCEKSILVTSFLLGSLS